MYVGAQVGARHGEYPKSVTRANTHKHTERKSRHETTKQRTTEDRDRRLNRNNLIHLFNALDLGDVMHEHTLERACNTSPYIHTRESGKDQRKRGWGVGGGGDHVSIMTQL